MGPWSPVTPARTARKKGLERGRREKEKEDNLCASWKIKKKARVRDSDARVARKWKAEREKMRANGGFSKFVRFAFPPDVSVPGEKIYFAQAFLLLAFFSPPRREGCVIRGIREAHTVASLLYEIVFA